MTFAPRRSLPRKRWRGAERPFIVNLAAFLVECATNAFIVETISRSITSENMPMRSTNNCVKKVRHVTKLIMDLFDNFKLWTPSSRRVGFEALSCLCFECNSAFWTVSKKTYPRLQKLIQNWVFPFSLLHDLGCDWSIVCQLDWGKVFLEFV